MNKVVVPFVLILLSMVSSCKNTEVLVIGHRGAMGHETENSIASIEKAIDLGVDMIEIDVFKIKSGELVVFHDAELERLTNGTGNIEDHTLNELNKLELIGGHKIPTLKAVLETINKRVQLNIELKGSNTAVDVAKEIEAIIISDAWEMDHFLISSFKWEELQKMRGKLPNVPIAILIGQEPLEALTIAKELNAVAINPSYKSLTIENVTTIKNAGFKIYPWTVNEADAIAKMKEIGVDGIITNFPERIK